MIVGGMHLNAVGGDCPGKTELHPDILLRPDCRIVVEYEPQSRIEGEIQRLQYRRQIDLVPDLDSPKDLFGGALGRRGRARMRKAA